MSNPLLAALVVATTLIAGVFVGEPRAVAEAAALVKKPTVIINEQIAVKAGKAQMHSFSLTEGREVTLEVKGLKHTNKGFSVYMIDEKDWAAFGTTEEFHHYGEFHGLKTRGFTKTGKLPVGRYAVVVQNAENMLNGLLVSVKVSVEQ